MAKYTNTHNLPEAMVKALIFDDYDYEKAGDISVTGLIQPVRIRQLTKRHGDEITEDASDLIWRMLGSIGHKIIERGASANTFSEERLTTKVHGWVITGKVDLMRIVKGDAGWIPDEYAIEDFKFRSVWAAKDLKPDDERQLNLYAALARHSGFNVTQLRIISVLRDWSKLRASREKDYPQVGVVVREMPLWMPVTQEEFLSQRVLSHQAAEKLADDDLPLCTPDERWRKPEIYAVKKKGGKRAVPGGLHSTLASAEAWAAVQRAENGAAHEIEHRPGEDTRCLSYCAVKQFCNYGKSLVPAAVEAA